MSARERTKGAAWEREVARLFRDAIGCDAHRGAQSRAGRDGPDVTGVPGFWIECKHQANPRAAAALRQATSCAAEAESHAWPIAVIKANRTAPYVVMGLDDFLTLVTQWLATE